MEKEDKIIQLFQLRDEGGNEGPKISKPLYGLGQSGNLYYLDVHGEVGGKGTKWELYCGPPKIKEDR